MHPLRAALEKGAEELGLGLSAQTFARLLDYLALLQKWGRVYNLTAVRSPQEMLTHHLLDSLAVIRPLRRELGIASGNDADVFDGREGRERPIPLLDVGSGAGLPGAVIAVCCPEIAVTCVDAVAKKAAFVQQVAANLGLQNLCGTHGRVEGLAGKYDVITARAFASLPDFTRLSLDALAADGFWLAMKGKAPEEELAALPASVAVFHVEQLQVPGLHAERCLVWMRANPAYRSPPGI